VSSERRRFLGKGTAAAAALVFGTAAVAQPDTGDKQPWRRRAYGVPADTRNRCATCVFWGGQRHVTLDKNMVHVESLGMCNNPESGNYHTITSPDSGPMKAWVKWPALEV
jgi:hypothetical protein